MDIGSVIAARLSWKTNEFSCPGTTVRLMNPMTYSINIHNGGKAAGLHIKVLLPGVVLGSRGPSEQPTYSRLTSFLPIREIPELIKTRPRLLHVSHPPWGDLRVRALAQSSEYKIILPFNSKQGIMQMEFFSLNLAQLPAINKYCMLQRCQVSKLSNSNYSKKHQ